jgi:autoinducer 2-degrading protein
MIIRIVKMTFDPEQIETFLGNFHARKQDIRAQDGCNHLQLLRDTHTPNIFMTYSWWDSEDHLNAYRHSDLFKDVWSKTKPLFIAKPEAWSVTQEAVLD